MHYVMVITVHVKKETKASWLATGSTVLFFLILLFHNRHTPMSGESTKEAYHFKWISYLLLWHCAECKSYLKGADGVESVFELGIACRHGL